MISPDTLSRAVSAALAEWELAMNDLPDEDDVDESRVMERVVLAAIEVVRPEIERGAYERAAEIADSYALSKRIRSLAKESTS